MYRVLCLSMYLLSRFKIFTQLIIEVRFSRLKRRLLYYYHMMNWDVILHLWWLMIFKHYTYVLPLSPFNSFYCSKIVFAIFRFVLFSSLLFYLYKKILCTSIYGFYKNSFTFRSLVLKVPFYPVHFGDETICRNHDKLKIHVIKNETMFIFIYIWNIILVWLESSSLL